MKRFMVLIICLYTFKVYAQDFDLVVKGGVNYAQSVILDVVGSDGVDMGDLEDERGMAVVFGGFARATFGKFVFQPEILFSENQSLADIGEIDPQDIALGDVLSMNVDKLDIPLLFGYNVFNKFRLMGGPVVSHIQSDASDPLFDLNEITIGYQAGLGFDINRLTFDARYEGNLSKFTDYIETDNGLIEVDSRKNIFQFTLGYKLFD